MVINIRKFIREELRKHLIENNNQNLFPLTLYSVTFHTSDSANNEYFGTDADRAKIEFESPDIPKNMFNRTDMSIEVQSQTNKYRFIYELDPEYESTDDYPIDEYYNDSSIYELVYEGDWEDVDYRQIKAANSESDILLSDVEHYYKQEYGNYKYNTINVFDENEEYKGCIQLRIANHTENIFNVDRFGRCNYYISVVIANHDATRERFGMTNAFERMMNERELIFDEDNDFEDVIEKINELIEEFKEEIWNK